MRWLLPAGFAVLSLAADDDGNAHLLPDGPGKEVIAKVCVECHSVDRMRTFRISKDEWSEKVADMIDRGAKATDAESQAVVDYLSRNFGKDSKISMNTAPKIEMKAILDLRVAEVDAIAAWRDSHGSFKDVNDVLKVPGIDPQKVAAKKDLMLF